MEKMNYQRGFVWKRIVWLIVAVIILGFLLYKAKEKVHQVIVNDNHTIVENHLLDATLSSVSPKSGIAGDVVEVSGYNFGNNPSVIFGTYCQKCDGYQIIKPISSNDSIVKFIAPSIATGKNSAIEVRVKNTKGLITDPKTFIMNPASDNQASDWKTYTSADQKLSFQYPSNWINYDNSMKFGSSDYKSFQLSVASTRTNLVTLDDYLKQIDELSKNADEGQPSKEVISTQKITVNGIGIIQREELLIAAGFKTTISYVKVGGTVYFFVLYPNPSENTISADDISTYSKIISTLKFTP